jgi:hypothetical protein
MHTPHGRREKEREEVDVMLITTADNSTHELKSG